MMMPIFVMLLSLQFTHSQFADVQINILPSADAPTPVVNITNLENAATEQKLVGNFLNVLPQTVDTSLQAELCGPGTFSQMSTGQLLNTQQCVKCPNGTASPVSGASDPSTCAPCPIGTYSWSGAAVCINCAANTFSVTPQAPNANVCVACPPNTASLPGSSAIENCLCNTAYFLSDNILTVNDITYDSIAISMPFTNAASIDMAHVTCFA